MESSRSTQEDERHTDQEQGSDTVTEIEQANLDSLNAVFSLRRPRDLGAGLSSGAKSLAKGVLAGGVTLIAAPAYGAITGGWIGFAKGVGIGRHSSFSSLISVIYSVFPFL